MNSMRFTGVLFSVCTLLVACEVAGQDASIVHYWNFENNFDDQVGAADGSVTGFTTVTLDAGHDGNTSMRTQATINGDDDIVRIDNTQMFVPGDDAFSFSYWFNIADDGTTDPRGIFDFSGDGGEGVQSLYIGTSDTLAFRVDGLAGGAPALFAMNFEDSQWHFVAAVYDPVTGIELYVDGPDVDATAGVVGNVTMDADQYLGAFNFNNPGDNKGLNGRLDDLAIYTGKLTSNQIQGLFDGSLDPTDVGSEGEFVPPASYSVFRGFELSGSLTDFADSDDVRARYNPGFTLNSSEAPVWLVFDGNAPSAVDFVVESNAGTPGLTYTVEAFNWNGNSYDVIGTQGESFNNDQSLNFAIVPTNHINGIGDVRGRVGWRKTGLTINFPWEVRIDQVGWNQ